MNRKQPIPIKETVAAYDDLNDDGNECFVFKWCSMEVVKKVFTTLYNQQLFGRVRIAPKNERHRYGFVERGWVVELFDYDHAHMSIADLKQLIREVFFIHGHELEFISYNRIINLKAKYHENYQSCHRS